jgi:hypothetical protein
MFKKREEQGFNLSFLDVMACGLGAVLLILIVVKFQDDTDTPIVELERLNKELQALQTQQTDLNQRLSAKQQQTESTDASIDNLKQRIKALIIQQQATQAALADKRAVVADFENAIAAIAPQTSADTIPTPNTSEETYLMGLKVEGRRIAILVDTSASMSAERLIDIISRKLGSDDEKRTGPKWLRTQRIVRWLLARLPKGGEFTVVAFNHRSKVLGKNSVLKNGDREDLESVLLDLNKLVPEQGTNLQQALNTLAQIPTRFTDVYVITDGLPTIVSQNSNFPTRRSCNPVEGKQATINGACRMEVFAHAIQTNPLQGVVTNIVLLPLEGDSQAPSAYWSWASFTNGTFIAPAGTWP